MHTAIVLGSTEVGEGRSEGLLLCTAGVVIPGWGDISVSMAVSLLSIVAMFGAHGLDAV